MPFDRVTICGLRKVFGTRPALIGVDAQLHAGQLTLLLGPNGAGKSTLLSILSTLSRPTSGEVRYGESDFASARQTLRRQIGLVGHAPMLYGELTVAENLLFAARMYGVAAPRDRVRSLLEQLALGDAAQRPAAQISRGMVQRAALARALLPDPRLLLLDEPFTGLDRSAVAALREQLARCRERCIVVLTTHDLEAAGGLADQLLVLQAGQIALTHSEGGLDGAALARRYEEALR